jgi:hypothetical protein
MIEMSKNMPSPGIELGFHPAYGRCTDIVRVPGEVRADARGPTPPLILIKENT